MSNRAPSATDFHVDVEGVGHFVFARRNMRSEMAIAAEYSRLTEGVDTPTSYLQTVAGWMAVLKVLTVDAPHGWDLDEMDPLDDDTHEKILKTFSALRAKEVDFRRSKNAKREDTGTRSSQ